MNDDWRGIPYLSERYRASRDGQVKTLAYTREYVRRPTETRRAHWCYHPFPERVLHQRLGRPTSQGEPRPCVRIYRGHSRSSASGTLWRVDKLVASAFHGIPYDITDTSARVRWLICHLDGDVANCHADNLQWIPRWGSKKSSVTVLGSAEHLGSLRRMYDEIPEGRIA